MSSSAYQDKTEFTGETNEAGDQPAQPAQHTGPAPQPGLPAGGYGPGPAAWLPPVNHVAEKAVQLGFVFGILGLSGGLLGLVFGPLALMKAKEAERAGGVGTGPRILGWISVVLGALVLLFFLAYGFLLFTLFASLPTIIEEGASSASTASAILAPLFL